MRMVLLGVEGDGGCSAPELTAPALCPQEMRSVKRPTSGLSSTQVSSTTRFHRALALGRQASPSLTPYWWEEAAGRPAGRPVLLPLCPAGDCPGLATGCPCPSRWGWCWRHLPAWGCHPNHWPEERAHIPWAAAHGYSPGGPESLPNQLHPNSHCPIQPWFLSPHSSPSQLAQGPPPTQGPRSPWSPRGWCSCLCPQCCPGVAPTPSLSCNFISSIKL